MKDGIRAFLRDESGQTTTEYILILAVIVTIFMQFRKQMVKTVDKLLKQVDDKTSHAVCEDGVCDDLNP